MAMDIDNVFNKYLNKYFNDELNKSFQESFDTYMASPLPTYDSNAPITNAKTSDAINEYWTANNDSTQWTYDLPDLNSIDSSKVSTISIDADAISVNGRSLLEVIDKMQKRLAILDDPTPEKLEKFAALKKAYEQYKILEKLCYDQGDDE